MLIHIIEVWAFWYFSFWFCAFFWHKLLFFSSFFVLYCCSLPHTHTLSTPPWQQTHKSRQNLYQRSLLIKAISTHIEVSHLLLFSSKWCLSQNLLFVRWKSWLNVREQKSKSIESTAHSCTLSYSLCSLYLVWIFRIRPVPPSTPSCGGLWGGHASYIPHPPHAPPPDWICNHG
jgi:hypothetical protein